LDIFLNAVKLAPKYPQVRFAHCGGPLEIRFRSDQTSAVIFGYIDGMPVSQWRNCRYATKSKKTRASLRRNPFRRYYAISIHLRSVRNPLNRDITTQVIFTGDWSLPVKEAESTNSLADQGVDVITVMSIAPKCSSKPPKNAALKSAVITRIKLCWHRRVI